MEVKKQVLRLQIPMDDAKLVEVLDAVNNLLEEAASVALLDPVVLDDVVEELSARSVLHNKVELFGGFDDLVVGERPALPRRAG